MDYCRIVVYYGPRTQQQRHIHWLGDITATRPTDIWLVEDLIDYDEDYGFIYKSMLDEENARWVKCLQIHQSKMALLGGRDWLASYHRLFAYLREGLHRIEISPVSNTGQDIPAVRDKNV